MPVFGQYIYGFIKIQGVHTIYRRSADGLRAHAENHRQLVDYHLRSPQMVCAVKHIRSLEFGPLHLLEIETPYYRHLAKWDLIVWRCEDLPSRLRVNGINELKIKRGNEVSFISRRK